VSTSTSRDEPAEAVFVVDTNVVVSGLITRDPSSPTAQLLSWMLAGELAFLLSVDLLAEYRDVLLRPSVARYHGLGVSEVDRLLTTLAFHGRIRQPQPASGPPPDPGDLHLWDLLAAEPGSILVTGDRLLLDHPPADTIAVPPGEALQLGPRH